MTVIPVDPFLDRDQWLRIRRQGLGASDAAAIFGVHPFESAFSLWLEKTGQAADEEPNEAMEWGLLLEPIVRHYFARVTGYQVARVGGLMQHPEHPWMLATLDGVVTEPASGDELGVYEGKTSSAWKADEWDFDADRVPDHVVIQCQHQMAVSGLPRAFVAVLLGGQQFRHTIVERDDGLIADLIVAEHAWWERHVVGREVPPVDGHDATTDALKAMFPTSDETELDLPPEAREIIARWLASKERVKQAKADEEADANLLRLLLGPHEVGRLDGQKAVTWKSHDVTRLDSKALRSAHPEVAEEFSNTTSERRLALARGFQP